jgi:TetR/AcrR family transcriptional regulator, transcriptional repressor for nem operon
MLGCVNRHTRRPVYYVRVTLTGQPARERLLVAASSLMHERGYEATGVAELCEAAGAPKGSFYYWWPTKQALALAMLDRQWELARERVVAPAFVAGGPIVQQFARYAELLMAVLRSEVEQTGSVHGCPFGNFVVELATRNDVIRSRAEEILSELRRVFATAIAAAKEAGELPADLDSDDLAEAVLAHLEGLFVIAKARNDPAVFERLPSDIGRLLASAA